MKPSVGTAKQTHHMFAMVRLMHDVNLQLQNTPLDCLFYSIILQTHPVHRKVAIKSIKRRTKITNANKH